VRAPLGILLLPLCAAAVPAAAPVVFEEVAAARGLRFANDPGRTDRRHQPESMGGGVALFDYDNDGWLDVYVVNGAALPAIDKSAPRHWNRLFHNQRDGTFADVSQAAGVVGRGYDIGVVAGDFDNDGNVDLFVTGLRANTLFRNNGNGTFSDVTQRAGLAQPDPRYGTLFAIAAAFVDYDHDGRLDLFVANYCVWDPKTEPKCGDPASPDYCHPSRFEGLPNSLFHNNGDGTFRDVSAASGIRAHVGKGMGIAVADFDGDGWDDLFVANDTTPAFLFMNNRNGTFTEASFERAVAFTDHGEPIAGMGADAGDLDNDGRPDIFETGLEADTFPVFRNLGGGTFEDATMGSGAAGITRPWTGWGNGIVDFNNDGAQDLFAACAGVLDPRGRFGERVPMANLLLLNQGNGTFRDGGPEAGEAFKRRAVHRGVAFGDIDNDGRVDAVVTALDGPLELWHNVSPVPHHWLLVKTVGTKSNRDGMGATLKLTTASGARYGHVNTAVGYGSSSDPRVHFGLGTDSRVTELTVHWPSGRLQTLKDVRADQILTVSEP
jgi:hypothetical protein